MSKQMDLEAVVESWWAALQPPSFKIIENLTSSIHDPKLHLCVVIWDFGSWDLLNELRYSPNAGLSYSWLLTYDKDKPSRKLHFSDDLPEIAMGRQMAKTHGLNMLEFEFAMTVLREDFDQVIQGAAIELQHRAHE